LLRFADGCTNGATWEFEMPLIVSTVISFCKP